MLVAADAGGAAAGVTGGGGGPDRRRVAVAVGLRVARVVVSEQLIPVAAQVTLGAALGFCVGYLLKKVGKLVAIIVGFTFGLLQVLAYVEVITINWGPIAAWWDQVRRPEHLDRQWQVVRAVLFAHVPALAGAVPGLILGLKKG